MLKEAKLPIEFQDKAIKANCYIQNRIATRLFVNRKQVSLEEAFIGTKPLIDHIRVQGSKCYSYVNLKTILLGQRHDKLVNTRRVRVFIGYLETTNKHFKVYNLELGYTSRTSRININKSIPRGMLNL